MKRYAIFKYLNGGQVEGEIVAYTEADDPFTACEQAGFPDQETHFARLVDKMETESEYIKGEQERLDKINRQLQTFIDADTKAKEQFEKDKPCPNCGSKMDKDYTCKKCGFGRDEVAIGGMVVNKKQLDKAIKQAKKQAKKTKV